MSEITDKIRSKAHWIIAIQPEPFNENRVTYEQLDEIVPSVAVRLRGWPVPFVDHRKAWLSGDDWIGQDIDATTVDQYEAWRFFLSGQFTHLRAVSADWREGDSAAFVPAGFNAVIEIWEILYYVTEVFELAARLALGEVGGDRIRLDLRLMNLGEKRGLVVGQQSRMEFMTPLPARQDEMRETMTLSREELVAEGKSRAVEMSREFFLRFGWKPSVDQLADHQRELTERG